MTSNRGRWRASVRAAASRLLVLATLTCWSQGAQLLAAPDAAEHDRIAAGQLRYFTDVALIDQDGARNRLYSDLLANRVVVVHAFFGSCKDACPVQLAKLRVVQSHLRTAVPLHILSISVDPGNDDSDALRAVAQKFDARAPSWRLLTGRNDDVALALRKFGLSAEMREAHNPSFVLGRVADAHWEKVPGTASVDELIARLKKLGEGS